MYTSIGDLPFISDLPAFCLQVLVSNAAFRTEETGGRERITTLTVAEKLTKK